MMRIIIMVFVDNSNFNNKNIKIYFSPELKNSKCGSFIWDGNETGRQ
jgi:hypothetical protein